MLTKKLLRELWQNKAQFINIFIMIFLSTFVFSGVHSYMDGMQEASDKFYKNNNLADLFVVGEVNKDDLNKIKELDNVKDASISLNITVNAKNTKYKDTTLDLTFIEDNNVNKLYLMDGEKYSKDIDGIWIEYLFAEENDLKVGDKITLNYENTDFEKEIKGIVEAPDKLYIIKDSNTIFPTHKDYGFAYISYDYFPDEIIINKLIEEIRNNTETINGMKYLLQKEEITDDDIRNYISTIDFKKDDYLVYNQIFIDLHKTKKIDEDKIKIEDAVDKKIAITKRSDQVSYSGYQSEIDEGQTYSKVFTLLFVIIAILSVITSTTRFVRKQRSQIGTMKALGISKGKIIFHYISYNLLISIVAALLGILVGSTIIGNFFLDMQMSFFEVPDYNVVILPIVYYLGVAIVILITLITYLSCKKILNEPASEAIRVERPKIKNRGFDITKLFKKASVTTKWNLRDVMRNKGRTITNIIGIMGCAGIIILAFGLLNTINYYIDWNFKVLNNYKYQIVLKNDITNEELDSLENKYGSDTSMIKGIEIKYDKNKKHVTTLTVTDANNKLQFSSHNPNNLITLKNGIYITEKLGENLNLKVGDIIEFHEFGSDKWYKEKIIGLNRDPQNQNMTITRKTAKELGMEYKPTNLYTNENLSSIKSIPGVETISSIKSLRSGIEDMMDRMLALIYLFVFVAVILAYVIIYNIGTLSYFEKGYQFSTLKVLGFSDKDVRKIFEQQGLWITIISVILACPFGYLFTDYIYKSALGDTYDFPTHIELWTYVIGVIGTIIVSMLTYKVLSKKITKIDMVSSLKANE